MIAGWLEKEGGVWAAREENDDEGYETRTDETEGGHKKWI